MFAALNTATGEVYHLCQQRHRHQEWLKFLRLIDQTVVADRTIHIICDNYATHRHPRVQRWLHSHKRFHSHFTPTSASWLNMFERFATRRPTASVVASSRISNNLTLHVKRRTDCSIAAGVIRRGLPDFIRVLSALPMNRDSPLAVAKELSVTTHLSALIINYLHVAFALHYWKTFRTADRRESMGKVLIVAFVAAKGSIFPDADVDVP